jgi:hypothetical protein
MAQKGTVNGCSEQRLRSVLSVQKGRIPCASRGRTTNFRTNGKMKTLACCCSVDWPGHVYDRVSSPFIPKTPPLTSQRIHEAASKQGTNMYKLSWFIIFTLRNCHKLGL